MTGTWPLQRALRAVRGLGADRRGSASVEFALWSALFFALVMVALDFGIYHMQSSRTEHAVAAAAVQSFQQGSTASFASIPAYVQAFAGDSGLTVTTSCNGVAGSCTNLNRSCACLKNDATFIALACGTTCSGTGMTAGSTAGYYLTIAAGGKFSPMVVPRGLLNNANISRSATVRLQ